MNCMKANVIRLNSRSVLEYIIYRKSLEHVEKIEHVEMTNGQNYMKKQWRRLE